MKLSSSVATYEFGVVEADEEEVILSGTAVVESSRYTFRKIARKTRKTRASSQSKVNMFRIRCSKSKGSH